MKQLENWVRQLIREKGPLSFRDFMYWSLYHPQWGYYNRTEPLFGKKGDFYTAPGVHPVFGETIARDLIGKWQQLGEPDPLLVVEFGAGQGTLARDILNGFDAHAPSINVKYHIVEISPRLRQVQQTLLAGKPVAWLSRLEELGRFTGVVLSNELLDAFPVHVVRTGERGWQESYVGLKDHQLVEEFKALTEPQLFDYIEQYLPFLAGGEAPQSGQRIEINKDALMWLQDVSVYLSDGFIITIDYGEEASALYEGRPHGSLRGYKQHQFADDLYSNVGEFDLTSDINFTSLISYGRQLGLDSVFYGTQAKYLLQAGILDGIHANVSSDPFHPGMRKNLAIKQLIMPGSMGERFKVLIQRKVRA